MSSRQTETSMEDIDDSTLAAATLERCKQVSELEAYRQRVIALGRKLTVGECLAMESWQERLSKRKTEERRQEQIAALHQRNAM